MLRASQPGEAPGSVYATVEIIDSPHDYLAVSTPVMMAYGRRLSSACAAMKCLYLVVRSLGPTGTHRSDNNEPTKPVAALI